MFCYDYYKGLLIRLVDLNYKFIFYDEDDDTNIKKVILRHDVDFSIEKALDLARFEKKISTNIKSVYFILISTDFYNFFSKKNQQILKEIIELGHEIGLHFDETKYSINNHEDFSRWLRYELNILSSTLNRSIKYVSMHRPSNNVINQNLEFDFVINTYNNVFFKDYKYISDSRMNWKTNPLEYLEGSPHEKIHLLTHPFWYSDNEESTKTKLMKFIKDAQEERFENISKNFKSVEEFISKEDIK